MKCLSRPVIIFWEFNHFLVVEGYRGGKFYLNDPAIGRRTVSEAEFSESFTGVVLDFEPVDARRFSQWSMGYIGYDTLASKEFTQIQLATGFDVKQLSGERIYDLLHVHLYAAEKACSDLEKIA